MESIPWTRHSLRRAVTFGAAARTAAPGATVAPSGASVGAAAGASVGAAARGLAAAAKRTAATRGIVAIEAASLSIGWVCVAHSDIAVRGGLRLGCER